MHIRGEDDHESRHPACGADLRGSYGYRPRRRPGHYRFHGWVGRHHHRFDPAGGYEVRPECEWCPITLAGKYELLIRIKGADNHTAFSGSTDLKTPTFPEILEASKVGDFVGVVQWGVGLAASACYQGTVITNPTRLVIDIRNS